jgi:hypothetical protein
MHAEEYDAWYDTPRGGWVGDAEFNHIGSGTAPLAACGYQVALLCLLALSLGGCATAPNVEQSHFRAPIRLLVMESPMAVDQGRLHAVLDPDVEAASHISDELIAKGKQHAQVYALSAMDSVLGKQAGLEVVTPANIAATDEIGGKDLASPITQEEADRLRTATGADALLRFGITDYGLTPKSWRSGYIAFEVTSTLVLAGIIAYSGSTIAQAAAGTYLIQETVEETAEAYVGFWALDVVCRPVRIEAELVRLDPVSRVWESSDTGLSDVKLSRLFRKVALPERNMQLDQATAYAVKDVVSGLPAAMENISSHPGMDSSAGVMPLAAAVRIDQGNQ